MRLLSRRWPARWLLVAGLCLLGPGIAGADGPRPVTGDDRMAEIVAAVRAEEAKYQNIEYTTRTVVRAMKQDAPADPGEITTLATRRVVLQGNRTYFHNDSFDRVLATKRHREEFSAYDGERTRTVISGHCVNIHLGRFEHPDIHPAHSLSLAHDHVNFPLSVFLSGTEAIHAHPKYPRFARETGTDYEFPRVVAHFEGEGIVDGLHCVKVRVDRWQYSKEPPALQYLWLAPERNYLCVKQMFPQPKGLADDPPYREMHVGELREVAPGAWFPMKITVTRYDADALNHKKQVVSGRTETTVTKVDLAPHYETVFFRDVPIPTGLPVFTIKDRSLVGSALPKPIGGELEKTKLAEVVARVAEQEKHYANLEVKARDTYKLLHAPALMEGLVTEGSQEGHSILQGQRAYSTSHHMDISLDGRLFEQSRAWAFDGQWTRSVSRFDVPTEGPQTFAFLEKGGLGEAKAPGDGLPMYIPHMLIYRDDWAHGPLSGWLVSPRPDEHNHGPRQFRYCGEAEVDGHPCIKLRCDTLRKGGDLLQSSVLYLAIDRNLIPIKQEEYGGSFGFPPMPSSIKRCDDFREIAPGTWYPFHVTNLAFDDWIPMAQGRILLQWRRETTVESVVLAPRVNSDIFHNVIVPEGTMVQVVDENQETIGQFAQPQDGPATITPADYQELLSQMKARIEKPAPQKAAR